MAIPLQIKAPHDSVPDELKDEIQDLVGKLDHVYNRITSCQVSLEGPGGHHRKGTHRVVLHLTVPGSKIVVSHRKAGNLSGAVHSAFNAAGRRLRKHVERQRGKVKRHEEVPGAAPPAGARPKGVAKESPNGAALKHKSRTPYRHAKPDWREES